MLKDAPLCLLPSTGALIHAMCDQIDTDVLIANEAAAVTDIPDVHVSARWPASIAMRSPSICDIDAASFPPELSDVGMDVNRDVNRATWQLRDEKRNLNGMNDIKLCHLRRLVN